MDSKFLQALESGRTLVLDGATGTNLQQRGLTRGTPAEVWLMEHPEHILALEKDFIAAGSDVILTCTFGGTSIRLAHSGLDGRVEEVNRRAVEIARQAVSATDVFVGGSMGPTGQLIQPLGPLSEADVNAAYSEQARILTAAGVDLLVIETQYDLTEAKVAVQAARSVSSLPLVVSFSYDRGVRTMMGVRPTQMANELAELPVDILGINCGRSLDENLKVLIELRAATQKPIWFKPNAGMPRLDDGGNPIYDVSPEQMGANVPGWIAEGARLIGGCCGTSPAHLAAIAKAVKNI